MKTHRGTCGWWLAIATIVSMGLGAIPEARADEDAAEDYGKRVERYDLEINPEASDLLKMVEEAGKLELESKRREYLGRWGELQYAEFEKRLKPGDVKMMK